jgi:integrase/recombinase XerD
MMEQYLVWMQTQNYSEDTVSTRRACLGYFIHWCREPGLGELADITRPVLERCQRWLYQLRKPGGEPLAFRTQNQRLHALKGFYRWLARRNFPLHNPASELELPHLESRLPKCVLSAEEAERVLAVADILVIQEMLGHDGTLHARLDQPALDGLRRHAPGGQSQGPAPRRGGRTLHPNAKRPDLSTGPLRF